MKKRIALIVAVIITLTNVQKNFTMHSGWAGVAPAGIPAGTDGGATAFDTDRMRHAGRGEGIPPLANLGTVITNLHGNHFSNCQIKGNVTRAFTGNEWSISSIARTLWVSLLSGWTTGVFEAGKLPITLIVSALIAPFTGKITKGIEAKIDSFTETFGKTDEEIEALKKAKAETADIAKKQAIINNELGRLTAQDALLQTMLGRLQIMPRTTQEEKIAYQNACKGYMFLTKQFMNDYTRYLILTGQVEERDVQPKAQQRQAAERMPVGNPLQNALPKIPMATAAH